MSVHGPLFHSDTEVDRMLRDIERTVADRGLQLVAENLAGSLKEPTGYYQSRVRVTRSPHGSSVNDDGVVYGPWLEGVGERNKSTRFKGYASFRRARQQLDREATRLALPVVERFVRAVT